MYLERFLLLQQRISRNPQFNRPVFGGMLSEGRQMVEVLLIFSASASLSLALSPIMSASWSAGLTHESLQRSASDPFLLLGWLLSLQHIWNASTPTACAPCTCPQHHLRLTVVECVQLTDIKAMLGVTGQKRVIMGCITQPQVGRYALMDPSGTLPLDLSQAKTTSGFYTGS